MGNGDSQFTYKMRPETLVFSGVARLPENASAKHVYGCFTIEIEVDPKDHKIVDASSTMLPALGEKILLNALIGNNMDKGIKETVDEIERRFFSNMTRAVIAALEDAYKWYHRYLREKT